MNQKGIAVVVALIGMTVVLMLSLAMVQSALGNLKTGGDLLNRAQARQRAEAGVDHALAYLDGKPSLSAAQTVSGQGYTATLTPQNPEGNEVRIESQGQAGLARHTAVAVVRLQPVPAQAQNPLFGQGWISGGRITINGGVDLWGSRLHADLGYGNLSGQIQVCDSSGQGCRNLNQVNPPPITGGAGVADTQCNASGNNRVVCDGSAPRYQVCPVYQTPSNPNLTCLDAVTGRVVRWDQATRITRPDVDAISRNSLGVRATSPYADATTNGLCDVRFTSLDPGNASELTQFLLSRGFSGSLPTDVNQLLPLVLSALNGSGLKVCVQNNVTLPGGTALSNVTFYVGSTFQVNGSATLNGVNVAAGSGINLGDVQATDSRFYTGGYFNLNNGATFRGNSTLASRQSLTFNGGADLLNNRALLVVSEGDITFNGRANTHAFMWAGGTIHFNGTGAFIGGAVSLGGTIRNGGGQFYIQNSNALNSDLPNTNTDSQLRPVVLSRR
ncbi:pilus assembly PilX family protein [Thermus sp.]|uniref:pilus assembly PilX family protein n=1 Tax=Thermus sp. TaxID=275 RepID=UPI003D0EFA6D